MAIYKFKCWAEKAVSGIIFPPDREQVRVELMNHLNDHYDALLEQGIDPEEAQQMAVEAMGDAMEIAPQLAAIHHPIWGYLLRVTRVLLVIAAICVLASGIHFAYNTSYSQPWIYRYDPYEDTYISDEVGVTTRLFYSEPNQTAESDGYTLTLTRAAWWYTDFTDETLQDDDSFGFQIRVFNPRPWAAEPDFCDWFWAEDSLGNHYYPDDQYWYREDSYVNGGCYHTAPLTYTLDMSLGNFCSQEAEWIDIHYDRDGRNILFRIDLTGGGAA